MNKKGNRPNMFMPTVIMGISAVVLFLVAYYKGAHMAGLNQAMRMTIQILPLLVFAFIVAGMVQVLLPHELISRWIGEESGMKGILLGTVAGAFTPGGPYVSLPIGRGAFEVRSEHRRDGGVYYRLESLGYQQVTDGDRHTRVEVCFRETFERFNTSAHSGNLGAFYQSGFEIKF